MAEKWKAGIDPPGSYGAPIWGALKDRLDFFWFQGESKYFETRMKQNKSTVFRVNFVPSPPGFPDPKGVALLDSKSYQILFDNEKVEKKNVFVGPFTPHLSYTGGYRMMAYLDPSEEKHTQLKAFALAILHQNASRFLPEFATSFAQSFQEVDTNVRKKGKADMVSCAKELGWNFLMRSIVHQDPTASLGKKGYSGTALWIAAQFGPIAHTGLPHFLEELFHSIRLPFFLTRSSYNKVVKFFKEHAAYALDVAQQQFGLDPEEALHNLIFMVTLNAWLAFNKELPALVYYIGKLGPDFHVTLRDEVRLAVRSNGGLNLGALAHMPLLESVVIEMLRLAPAAKYQYGRAKMDLIVESHEASFLIKKGELLGANQEFPNRDPHVFKEPDTFVPDRFMGKEGKDLLQYVFWSNGKQTDSTTPRNKQCAGKGFVEMVCSIFVAHLFLKYDTFSIARDDHLGTLPEVTIVSLKDASLDK